MQTHLPHVNPSTAFRIAYDEALNPSQLEAVKCTEGPLLVIAGAGSGKTRTLTYRVARLVEAGIAPRSILLLSFTRKASQEMLKRASQLLDGRCESVSGGTFHSFAHLVLRRYASKLGFESGFTIIDRADSETLFGMIRKDLGAQVPQGVLPRKETLANIMGRAVNKAIAIDRVVLDDYPHFSPQLAFIEAICREYARRKREQNFLDYDDLLVFLQQLMRGHEDIRSRLCSTYRYIMVDEYQDTNPIQADIVTLLAGGHRNVMVVGDDSQSIYAFRGADFRNIMNFPAAFPGTRIIKLEENYRSVQPILNLTNTIIARAEEKFTKELYTRKAGGNRPFLICAGTENAQSRYVVSKIMELTGAGIPLSQIAVLFRASFHSFDLEIELGREAIPFIKVGGFKFTESAHIKDLLAHLRVIASPKDRLSWYRILLLLPKVGPQTALRLYEAIVAEQAGYAGILSIRSKAGQSSTLERLKALYAGIDPDAQRVAGMGEAVLNYYKPILVRQFDDHPKRLKDLEHLLGIMERYTHLSDFLSDMALEPPNATADDVLATASGEENRLTLSTVHSAKGLEWQAVFILWALDGRFPSIHSLNQREALAEELRLMYVAATRAKAHLFFTYPAQAFDRGSGLYLSRPSRFIDHIPDAILAKEFVEF
jgi:DNA helicase-2/ATP-dependent DNA helicase PcrA